MSQDFPLLDLDPSSTSGAELADHLKLFSATMRSMMSGQNRPEELIEGLWLQINPSGTRVIVYSNTEHGLDVPLFWIDPSTGGVSLLNQTYLGAARYATDAAAGVVELATADEAVAGTDPAKVMVVKETKDMIDRAIAALMGESTGVVDTIHEIGLALGDNPNFATDMLTALANRLKIDGSQTLSAEQQAHGRDNLGLGPLAVGDRVGTDNLNEGAVTSTKIANDAVDRNKLNGDVFATTAESLTSSPPEDLALTPNTFFDLDEVAIVDVTANAPTTLAGNGYRRWYFNDATRILYRYVPPPVDKFIPQAKTPGLFGDLIDLSLSGASNGDIVVKSGASWVAKSNQLTPVGVIQAFAGTSAPGGYFICDGSAFDGAVYPQLAAVLGSTTLPDLRGVFLRGLDNGRGLDPNRERLSYQEDEFKSHAHRPSGNTVNQSFAFVPNGNSGSVFTSSFAGATQINNAPDTG